ncbi:anhydro-N-acetylmuramic acid kinase [Pseudoalteromonas fenneropenaei]|uniref:Anhydro-N-acetylmuramic acid kinase n=1 Tax=Pseudoalteromonas fenneropenaei TaxID=1737459 RepID=A0ABV7CG88_9GAMM
MHPHLKRLSQCADAPHRLIIGLMSGTSLDGLDVALCRLTGCGNQTQCELLAFETLAYSQDEKATILSVFSKAEVSLQQLTLVNAWLGRLHGEMVNSCLAKWQVDAQTVDCIASHGQTIFHCPKHQHGLAQFGHATLQIGDADHLAVTTGITTLSDFRQKHIAVGGEGAPLAIYGDHLLFSDATEHRVLLNLGGIANLTLLPANGALESVLCSDLGPANTMIDAYVRTHLALPYDKDGALARAGSVHQELLAALCNHDFCHRALPKSTGPEVFNLALLAQAQAQTNTTLLSHQDVVSTLTEFSAWLVAEAISELALQRPNLSVYASGGGASNPELVARIIARLDKRIHFTTTSQLGVNPDAKEAILFALLANESLCVPRQGEASVLNVAMGKISFPS